MNIKINGVLFDIFIYCHHRRGAHTIVRFRQGGPWQLLPMSAYPDISTKNFFLKKVDFWFSGLVSYLVIRSIIIFQVPKF